MDFQLQTYEQYFGKPDRFNALDFAKTWQYMKNSQTQNALTQAYIEKSKQDVVQDQARMAIEEAKAAREQQTYDLEMAGKTKQWVSRGLDALNPDDIALYPGWYSSIEKESADLFGPDASKRIMSVIPRPEGITSDALKEFKTKMQALYPSLTPEQKIKESEEKRAAQTWELENAPGGRAERAEKRAEEALGIEKRYKSALAERAEAEARGIDKYGVGGRSGRTRTAAAIQKEITAVGKLKYAVENGKTDLIGQLMATSTDPKFSEAGNNYLEALKTPGAAKAKEEYLARLNEHEQFLRDELASLGGGTSYEKGGKEEGADLPSTIERMKKTLQPLGSMKTFGRNDANEMVIVDFVKDQDGNLIVRETPARQNPKTRKWEAVPGVQPRIVHDESRSLANQSPLETGESTRVRVKPRTANEVLAVRPQY